jgi:hypothetical protein
MYCIIKSAISLALLFEIYIIFEKITTVLQTYVSGHCNGQHKQNIMTKNLTILYEKK